MTTRSESSPDAPQPKIGDNAQITSILTKMHGELGTIVDIREREGETMPYIIEFPNYDRLPYALNEFEYWSNSL